MDLYVTDSGFIQQDVIDDYESMIWTDRFATHGDFELLTPWSETLATNLRQFKFLTQGESQHIMMIETAELARPSEEVKGNLVKITGRSFEAFFENRDNTSYTPGGGESVVKEGTPGQIANEFVNELCINNPTAVYNIPGLELATPPSGTSVKLTVPRGPLPGILTNVLEAPKLGYGVFKRYTNGIQDSGKLVFRVYAGVDRSNPNPGDGDPNYVIYSPETETLIDTASLESIAGYKNHARVLGAKTVATVYIPNVPSTISGLERRTLVIDASDIGADSTTTVAEDQEALKLRGLEVLLSEENRFKRIVDGTVPQSADPLNDVGLGDIIWIQDSQNVKSKVRITEKIWTSDRSGDQRIPTFEAV